MTNEEMLDKAIQFLVDMETDIPCEEMFGYTDYCEDCGYNCPQKECWQYFLSGKWKDEWNDSDNDN